MSEIRHDPLSGADIIVAPERLRRPDALKKRVKSEQKGRCPFCEGNESLTPSEIFALREGLPDTPGWRTRVVPNLYRAVEIEAPWREVQGDFFEVLEGFGAHEVVIDTPRHPARAEMMTHTEIVDWLKTLRARLVDLRGDMRLVYFAIFKNHGSSAGATQPHPHTQIVALPTIPSETAGTVTRALEFFNRHGVSIFEEILGREDVAGRVIWQAERFAAVAPFASRFAFETVIISRRAGEASLADLDDDGIEALATVYRRLIKALYRQLGDFDFNLYFPTPPMQRCEATAGYFDQITSIWRLHLRITPRLFELGGLEAGQGIFINPVPPEEAARRLRESLERIDED